MTTETGAPAPTPSPAPAPAPAAPAPAPAPKPEGGQAPAPSPAPAAPMKLDDDASAVPAPVLPTKVDEPAPTPDDSPTPVTYEPTGHSGLDMALAFLGKLGFGPDHAAMEAAGKGDFNMLRAALSVMGDKATGWEAHLKLGEDSFTAVKAEKDARAAKDREGILAVVGGEEAWKSIQAWATAAAEPAEKIAVNAALQSGGIAAKAMAHYLATQHARATGTTLEPSEVTGPGGASRQSSVSLTGPLSPTEYKEAIHNLRAKVGSANLDQRPEYIALNNRRRAWRG